MIGRLNLAVPLSVARKRVPALSEIEKHHCLPKIVLTEIEIGKGMLRLKGRRG